MKWDIKKLGEVGNIYTGKTPPTTDQSNFDGSIPFATPSDLRGKIIKDTKRHVSEKGMKSLTLVREGSTLVGCIGDVGKVGYAAVPMTFNQQINAIEWDNKIIYDRYGYYTLLYMANVLKRKAVSSVVPILNKTNFSKVKIPVPPIENQKHMISLLDAANNILQLREEAITKLNKLAQSVFESMFGDFNKLINHKLFKLGDLISDKTLGLVRGAKLLDANNEYPYLRMNAITQNSQLQLSNLMYANATGDEVKEYQLKKKDFLFNTRNSKELVGKTAIFDLEGTYLFNNNIMRIRFNQNVNATYMSCVFMTSYIQKKLDQIKSGTTNVYAIYFKDLKNIEIPLPHVSLQNEFNRKVEDIFVVRGHHLKSIICAKKLIQSLRNQLFSIH